MAELPLFPGASLNVMHGKVLSFSRLWQDLVWNRTKELIITKQQNPAQGYYFHCCSPAPQYLLCLPPLLHETSLSAARCSPAELNLQPNLSWTWQTGPVSSAPLLSQSTQSHRKFQGCFFLTEINLFSQEPDHRLLLGFHINRPTLLHCS